jgi:hypothetical protein
MGLAVRHDVGDAGCEGALGQMQERRRTTDLWRCSADVGARTMRFGQWLALTE